MHTGPYCRDWRHRRAGFHRRRREESLGRSVPTSPRRGMPAERRRFFSLRALRPLYVASLHKMRTRLRGPVLRIARITPARCALSSFFTSSAWSSRARHKPTPSYPTCTLLEICCHFVRNHREPRLSRILGLRHFRAISAVPLGHLLTAAGGQVPRAIFPPTSLGYNMAR